MYGYNFTLDMERGAPKSLPPEMVNPQGPPPAREMILVAMTGGLTNTVRSMRQGREGRREGVGKVRTIHWLEL